MKRILIFLLFSTLFSTTENKASTITYAELDKNIIANGDLEKIVICNDKLAKIFIKKNSLELKRHQKANRKKGIPNYQLHIYPGFNFEDLLEKSQAKYNIPKSEWVYPEFETKSDLIGPLIGWFFPFVLVLINYLFSIIGLMYLLKRKTEISNFKLVWALILIFIPLGYVLFFFIGKKQLDETG